MLDGLAFVKAQKDHGAHVEGARTLLVGAGGAGRAIAIALLEAGIRELTVHDAVASRVATLLDLIANLGDDRVKAGPPDPTDYDLIFNATPMGMEEGDPLPINAALLNSSMHWRCDCRTQSDPIRQSRAGRWLQHGRWRRHGGSRAEPHGRIHDRWLAASLLLDTRNDTRELSLNQQVPGSSPGRGTNKIFDPFEFFRYVSLRVISQPPTLKRTTAYSAIRSSPMSGLKSGVP
jgi:hypothetical protein